MQQLDEYETDSDTESDEELKVILKKLARYARPGPEEQCVHLSVWIYEVGIIWWLYDLKIESSFQLHLRRKL